MQILILLTGAAVMVGAVAMVWPPAAIFAVGALLVRAGAEMKDEDDDPTT